MDLEFNYKGYTVVATTEYSNDGEDFFEYFDYFFTMECFHRDFYLGNKQMTSVLDFFQEKLDTNNEDMQKLKDRFENSKKFIMLPLFLHNHSGLSMSTVHDGDRWDTGQVGYIYATVEDIKKEFDFKNLTKKRREEIRTYMQSCVDEYDMYLTGEHGFMDITIELTNIENGEVTTESAFTYYTDDDSLKEFVIDTIDCL